MNGDGRRAHRPEESRSSSLLSPSPPPSTISSSSCCTGSASSTHSTSRDFRDCRARFRVLGRSSSDGVSSSSADGLGEACRLPFFFALRPSLAFLMMSRGVA